MNTPMNDLPALSRCLDRATGLCGLLALVVALALPGSVPAWQAWLALPVIVAAGRRPLELPTTTSESLVVGLDSALLVLLGLTLPLPQAMVVWSVSILVGELTTGRSLDTRLFNAGVCILAGALALAVLGSVPADHRSTPAGLAATVAAAGAYFAADYLWSGLSVAVAERISLRRTLQASGLLLAFACFLAVNSLGYLAAVVLGVQPWAVVLLLLPLVSLLLATHSWSQLGRVEQTSRELSMAAVALQQAVTADRIDQLVLDHAPRLVRAPAADWADVAVPDEAGLAFEAGGVRRHLVLARRITGEALTVQDRDALRLLLHVAEQAHERLRLLAELRRSALHDPLTGLPNRAVFREALAAPVPEGEGVAVLYCDLDGFKRLNDTRGHAAGDALLVAVAGRLAQALRPGDLAVRLGGDEFAVLLRGLSLEDGASEADGVAQRVCAELARPYDVAGGDVQVTASIGLCVWSAGDCEDLLSCSDAAMYAAKAEGGGLVRRDVPAATCTGC